MVTVDLTRLKSVLDPSIRPNLYDSSTYPGNNDPMEAYLISLGGGDPSNTFPYASNDLFAAEMGPYPPYQWALQTLLPDLARTGWLTFSPQDKVYHLSYEDKGLDHAYIDGIIVRDWKLWIALSGLYQALGIPQSEMDTLHALISHQAGADAAAANFKKIIQAGFIIVAAIALPQAASAAGLGTSTSQAVQTGATSSAVDASSSLFDTVKSVFSNLNDFISSVGSTLQSVIGPLASTISTIADTARKINDGLIQPVVGPIIAAEKAYAEFTAELHRDLSGHLMDLARIPGALADALTSTEAAFDRSSQQLGALNRKTAEEVLAPGLQGAAAGPLSEHAEKITENFNGPEFPLHGFHREHLPGDQFSDRLGEARKQFEAYKNGEAGWIGKIGWMAMEVFQFAGYLAASIQEELKQGEILAREKDPIDPLSAGDIVTAYQRGILGRSDALAEAARNGLSEERFDTLVENAEPVLDPATTMEALRRDIIDSDSARNELKRQGVTDERIRIFEAIQKYLPSLDEGIAWYRRGFIDREQLEAIASHRGLDLAELDLALQNAIAPPNPSLAISADARERASETSYLEETLNSQAPEDYRRLGDAAGVSASDIQRLWLSHWSLPDYREMILLYFRGFRTLSEVYDAMLAQAIPKELWNDLIEVNRPLPRFTYLSSFFEAGIITEGEAIAEFEKYGYDRTNAERLLAYAKTRMKNAKTETAAKTHQESLSTATGLFQDGAIDETQYSHLLAAHGLAPDAVTSTIQLENLKKAKADRKVERDHEVALAVMGTTTLDEMQTRLFNAGFSAMEVNRASNEVLKTRKTSEKLPDLGQVHSMYRKGIIDGDVVLVYLRAAGYNDFWAANFLKLFGVTTPQELTTPSSAP